MAFVGGKGLDGVKSNSITFRQTISRSKPKETAIPFGRPCLTAFVIFSDRSGTVRP